MSFQVVFLHSAKLDLQELKTYITKNFSNETWRTSYGKLKESVDDLGAFPFKGQYLKKFKA